jgi:redox-sensitive bicupin YhaK (pirin superfamily)
VQTFRLLESQIQPGFVADAPYQHFPADSFPYTHPIDWLTSHFAVGGWSPLQRLSGMLTAHMTQIAPRAGFTWHPHRALEIYTWVLEGELYHEDTTGGKGIIKAGELQRMFAGDYIEHQELNLGNVPARVIQIWYIADRKWQGLEPHYQQVGQAELPARAVEDATVYSLIGADSPMLQHMNGRLTAGTLSAGGRTTVEEPKPGESLFLYVTDGAGYVTYDGSTKSVGQYDVILARPDTATIALSADGESSLRWLSFYLPEFLSN